jgi:hypothetical protein
MKESIHTRAASNFHGGFRPLAGKWDESIIVTTDTDVFHEVSVPLRGSGMKDQMTPLSTVSWMFPSPCGEVG